MPKRFLIVCLVLMFPALGTLRISASAPSTPPAEYPAAIGHDEKPPSLENVGRPTPASGPIKVVATQPTTQAATAAEIQSLIRRLGAPDYREREAAHQALARLGEAAMPRLADLIGSANAEIANRVAALITRPVDPGVRVEVAVRLLATADPDWMEVAVYMLFQEPVEDYERFVERTSGAKGIRKAIFGPVAEQLRVWRDQTLIFNRTYERLRREKPEGAKRLREMHVESIMYQAEAAYWSAVEAAEEFEPIARPVRVPASGPADRSLQNPPR